MSLPRAVLRNADRRGYWLALSCCLFFFATYVLVGAHALRVIGLGGDEPYYLLIAHSLAYDRDIDLANNFAEQDYWAYHPSPLEGLHAIPQQAGGAIISVHDIGLPVLIAPFYRIAGRWGAMVLLSAVTALTVALCARAVFAHTRSPIAVGLAALTIGLSVPSLPYSAQIYPAAVAALLVVWMLSLLDPVQHPAPTQGQIVAYSAAIGFLPWLSIKYAVLSAVLAGMGLSFLRPAPGERRARRWTGYGVPVLVFAAAWVALRLRYYGSLSPAAQYGGWGLGAGRILRNIGALLLDQEHGLLPYTPAYLLVLPGMVVMWRAGRRRSLARLSAVLVPYVLLVASWSVWWAGWSFPARFLAAVVPVLAVPLGYLYAAAWHKRRRVLWRGGVVLLIAASAGLSLFGMYDPGYRLRNRRDGSANLFLDLAPRQVDLTAILPAFVPYSSAVMFPAARLWGEVGEVVPAPDLGGREVRHTGQGDLAGYLARGAQEILAAGLYRVCATAQVGAAREQAGRVEVVIPGSEEVQILALAIGGADAGASTEYEDICKELIVADRTRVDVRLWSTGKADFSLSDLWFERLGPWSPELYALGETVPFSDPDLDRYLGEGWSAAEPWGRWAVGASSSMRVHLKRRDTVLTLIVFPYPVEGQVQRLDISYNDVSLGEHELGVADAQEVSVTIPRAAIGRQVDVLRFEYAYATSPSGAGGGDRRPLAVGFIEAKIRGQE